MHTALSLFKIIALTMCIKLTPDSWGSGFSVRGLATLASLRLLTNAHAHSSIVKIVIIFIFLCFFPVCVNNLHSYDPQV